MANSTPFRTTPQLGPQLDDIFPTLPYWDLVLDPNVADLMPSHKLGDQEMGSDGRDYWWVKASADIAATATTGTQVVITVPAYTVATGSGGFYTPVNTAIVSGSYFWVSRGAKNAVPA
jgi:hypothetical protein